MAMLVRGSIQGSWCRSTKQCGDASALSYHPRSQNLSVSTGCTLGFNGVTSKLACTREVMWPVSLLSFTRKTYSLHKSKICATGDTYETDAGCPESGAVIFKRSAGSSQYEFVTTLERLDLAELSNACSRKLSSAMGLNSSDVECTPVSISLGISKEGGDLRLSGMVRTALGLYCNWCLDELGERVYTEVNFLLTGEPPREPTGQNAGVVFNANLQPTYEFDKDDLPDSEELDIDLDDKLYFPPQDSEIDISSYIRDTVYLSIPKLTRCSADCKGQCLNCGVNLNRESCDCEAKDYINWSPDSKESTQSKRRRKKP